MGIDDPESNWICFSLFYYTKGEGRCCNCGLLLPFIITVQEDPINDMIRRTEYNIRGPLLNYYFGRKRTGRAWMANIQWN